jgi:hypothetical protein
MSRKNKEDAQGLILALLFVVVAVAIGAIALWGFMNLNFPVGILGSIGEVAWFFGGRYIL